MECGFKKDEENKIACKTLKEELKIRKDGTVGVKRTLTSARHKQQAEVKPTGKINPERKISNKQNYNYNLIVTRNNVARTHPKSDIYIYSNQMTNRNRKTSIKKKE